MKEISKKGVAWMFGLPLAEVSWCSRWRSTAEEGYQGEGRGPRRSAPLILE